MKRQSRPIGRHVIQTCEVLEQIGPATSRDVSAWTSAGVNNQNKYCLRAVLYGFATVDKQRTPFIFEVRENWRQLLADFNGVPQVSKPEKTGSERRANSAFALANVWKSVAAFQLSSNP